jgi:hypothetical protein
MTLTAFDPPDLQPAPVAKSFDDGLDAAFARLALLHDEAAHTFRQSQLLDRAPSACLGLMLTGAVILFWMAREGGAGLAAGFVWSLWLLTGIAAITVIYVRSFARHPALMPLDDAVKDLRKFLLYTGLAWGLGTVAVMPDRPGASLIFAFAALPGLAVAWSFRDRKMTAVFCVPVLLLSAGATLLRQWSYGLAAVLLAGLACFFMLQCAIAWRSDPLSR